MTAEVRRRGKIYAANGDFKFFGYFDPVGSCFGVGVCVVLPCQYHSIKSRHGGRDAYRRRLSGRQLGYPLRLLCIFGAVALVSDEVLYREGRWRTVLRRS